MAYVIAQLSDIHIGGHTPGSGERFSQAIDEINAMTRRPDLVLLTGDVTHNGTPEEWDELCERLSVLQAPWEAIAGNHDKGIAELAGHRSMAAGPLRLVLVDTSDTTFPKTIGFGSTTNLRPIARSRPSSPFTSRRSRPVSGGWIASGSREPIGSRRWFAPTRR